MTFEEYLAKRDITLKPWQKEASDKFLKVAHTQRQFASGKSLLAYWLEAFLNEHGNDFEI